tara:strand:- start:1102 stop:1482 length:381 start_codon:yes stop_codon:yes gene_type:complete
MASDLLDISLKFKARDTINGLLTLDIQVDAALTYDDQNVVTNTISVATGADSTIFADTGVDGTVYIYLKNTDPTNFIVIKNDTHSSPIGRVNAGEFAFLPVDTNEGLKVRAAGDACIVEYITLKKA